MNTGFGGADVAGSAVSAESDLDLLRETIRRVATGAIAPEVAGMERSGSMPEAALRALVQTDFHAPAIPTRYGGAGAGALEAVVVIEEVARVSAAASVIPAQGFVASCALAGAEAGSEQAAVLSAIAGGELVATSPLAGARAAGVVAEAVPGGWRLEGVLDWVPWPYPDSGAALVAVVETAAGPRLLAGRLAQLEPGMIQATSMLGFRGVPLASLRLSGVVIPSGAVATEGAQRQPALWRAARLIATA
ncbi:MAG: acyl-CoA dehydrogenase family protein, partial [Actinomycetota bacterium]|nr:acyl-CoA dehydrogenase family protein [Actinomycetota bacterium]